MSAKCGTPTDRFVRVAPAAIGLLLMPVDAFGRQRVGPSAVGFACAALSRQMTIAHAIPLLYPARTRLGADAAHRPPAGLAEPVNDDGPAGWAWPPRVRSGRLGWALASIAAVVGTAATSNHLKFGHPLDSGYLYVYKDRPEDAFARDARTHGLFSTHYVPRNLYHASLGFPQLHRIVVDGRPDRFLRPNTLGTGIWWTTPLLLWLLVDLRRLLRDPHVLAWRSAAAVVAAGLMLYHGTGREQRGFNRYSLDYLPALFAGIAPRWVQGTARRGITLALVAWSVIYLRGLLGLPNVRIW